LARNLHAPTNRVTQILNRRRAITGDTALRLAHFFGTSAQFWLNLQNLYELRLAQQRAGKAIQALPTRKRSKATARKKFALEALAYAITAGKRHAGRETDLDQGKEVSRGDRRTR
jgi:plasmid maintenance system antidote protein VapI